jgi:D-alanyl-D-alanine carboxypeptidase
VALTVDGRPALVAAVGHRDLEGTKPLDPEARFYAYSITKTFLAIAVLRLAEQGHLGLDDRLQAILPETPVDEPVTLRQVLNHTAGLPDYGSTAEYNEALRADPGAPWTSDRFLTRTLRLGVRFAAGRSWAYSNIGFLLVRLVIERITQQPMSDALADLVFRPAGLRQTFVAESLADGHALTPGYSAALDDDGDLRDVSHRYHPGWVAHGVAISTAPDLARAMEHLLTGRLLDEPSMAAMLTAVPVPGRHPLVVRPAYGLGLMVDLASPYGLVAGHAGGGPGYSAAAFHVPDVAGHRLTSVALVNRDRPDLGMEIAFALVDAFAARNEVPRPT